jgi:WD40 repeat protein
MTIFEIPKQNSIEDIEKYIQSRIGNLSFDSTADREELATKILQRCNASFLWVRLVLDELEQLYSQESIMEVLDGIPEGMMPYYERTVRTMAENKKEKHIAKAVLVWVVASARKLTIPELSNALKLDVKTHLPSAKGAVIGLCGQLITVDEATGVVDIIHPTAREFLLSEAAGEFALSKSQADQQLALTCLQLLSSTELQRPRNRKFLAPRQQHNEPSPLLDYAITQFSEHVSGVSSEADDLLVAMDRFFHSNALSWVEHVAHKGNLHYLIRAAKNFKAYLAQRAKYRLPLSDQVRNVEAWSVDLSRLVTKFGSALLERPSSIHFLIPPLCPSQSAISRQFGRRPDDLAVVGFKNEAWDDCVTTVDFGDDAPSCISCGESLAAVGMDSGDINIYNNWSYHKEKVLHLEHAVDLIHLAEDWIVACTTKMITLRDLNGNTIWEHRLRFRCILLTSSDSEVIAVAQHGVLLRWDIKDGTPLDNHSFPYRPFDSVLMQDVGWGRAPFLASVSPDLEVLALAYRGGVVCLWELGSNELIGWARDDKDRLASALLFNPNPEVGLLLVAYTNHKLSLYDSWSSSLVNTHEPPNHVGLLSASCSPDGRTLATTDMRGNMQIWEFSSLTLLYHVSCPHSSFRILNFASDGSSIVEVMDSNMRVWSPSVLVRKNIEEEHSVGDDAPHMQAKEGRYKVSRTSRITAICSHPSLPLVFAGTYTGQIIAFNTRNGQEISTLYSHSSTRFITELAVSKQDVIASSDVFGIVQVRKLASGKPAQLESETVLLQRPAGAPIRQLAFTPNGNFLLISRTLLTEVYSMKDVKCVGTLIIDREQHKIWRWLPLPAEDQFLMICDDKIRSYSAHTFPGRTESFNFNLDYVLPEGSIATTYHVDAFHNDDTHVLILGVIYELGCATSSATFLFDLKNEEKERLTSVSPIHRQCFDPCKLFLGYAPRMQSFVVLQRDSWVSTIAVKGLAMNEPKQHFYVPDDYVTTGNDVIPVKTAEDDIVFCLHGELAIMKNGLKS